MASNMQQTKRHGKRIPKISKILKAEIAMSNNKIKVVLNHIDLQGYDRFIMQNNINDDKILAYEIKLTDELNLSFK